MIRYRTLAGGGNALEFAQPIGRVLLALGRNDEAAGKFSRALEERRDDPGLLNDLAVAELRRGHIPRAEVLLRRAASLRPGVPETHLNLATVYEHRAQWNEAAAEYRRFLRQRPDSAQGWLGLARSVFRIEGRSHGEEMFSAARRAEGLLRDDASARASALNLQGLALRRLGRRDEALARFEQAVAVDPSAPLPLRNLAVEYEQRGDPERANALRERSEN